MKISEESLKKDIKELENALARNYGKKDYVFDFLTGVYYDEMLSQISGDSTDFANRLLTPNIIDKINNEMSKSLHYICNYYNENSDMIHKAMINFDSILSSDDVLDYTPTYQLNHISFNMFKDLILSYYSQYGNKIYGIVKKYMDEDRIEIGSSMDDSASGVFLGANISQKGYITIERKKKLSLYTAETLVHELGHAIDFETFIFPQRKKIYTFDDLLIELPSYHFEVGFLDYLIQNNVHPNDAHALMMSIYQEYMAFADVFDKVKKLENFYIEDGGFITNEKGNFLDMYGNEMTEEVPEKPMRKLDATELIKYSLGMYLAFQTNQLASQDRKEYLKHLFNATTLRKESSLVDSLEYLGISKEQFESCSLVESRVKDELKHTRKMWKF